MNAKVKGAITALFIIASIGITGAVVPQIQNLNRSGSTAAFPLYVLVGSAVALAMLIGFFVGRHRS